MKRRIIDIDQELCNGCGRCIPNCPEGALQLIEGKARLVSELFCDGLGACIGECPLGAISVEEREAEAYDERRVMQNIIRQGEGTVRAHLRHLREHGEEELLRQAGEVLAEKGMAEMVAEPALKERLACGCPGSQVRELEAVSAPGPSESPGRGPAAPLPSELRQWPVQLHLLPPSAPYLKGADVLLAADCSAYCCGDFHREFLKGKRLAIACPKLDSQQDIYLDKLKALMEFAGIRSLTVLTMEVPCCRGLLALARQAAAQVEARVPLYWTELSVQGEVLRRQALAGEALAGEALAWEALA
jgi:ferredoxin